MASLASPPRFGRTAAFFRRYPVLLLLALSPGIPEYLSGSTSVEWIVRDPLIFLVFLGLNLGLYGPGVLLVRESWVRGGSSWGALLLFGVAYGLLEEGTALSTLFNPSASVVGTLGVYGRYAGVNGVWTVGVLAFHVVFSIGLPLVLLGLALPATRGRSILSRRGIVLAIGIFALDVVALGIIAGYYTEAWPWIAGAAVIALALWAIAGRLPADALAPPRDRPSYGPRAFAALGLVFFPFAIAFPAFGEAVGLPAPATIVLELAVLAILFSAVRRTIGRGAHDAQLVALAFGATLPLVVWGLISQIELPVVLVLDALWALFFYALWDHYRPRPTVAPAVA